ncbi:MAG TPA: hypothetical protein VFB25_00560 [Gaiellaceae bacterium]|nr:hypothetical protein [Gaiellaceae bacterium]
MQRPELSPLYVAARRVLLDALEALTKHQDALVICGAQAVYLRTGSINIGVAPYTTDSDLAVDPDRLGQEPEIGELMKGAGFSLWLNQGSPEPGSWVTEVEVNGSKTVIPVDLIVPEEMAGAGSRGARLEGHGKRAARRARGLEGALIDNDSMGISALDADDPREFHVKVAGIAALLVAKSHKIYERVNRGRTERIDDKDAADVYRLMAASSVADLSKSLERLLADPVAGEVTRIGVAYLLEAFGSSRADGVAMAKRALALAVDPDQVEVLMSHYANALADAVGDLAR